MAGRIRVHKLPIITVLLACCQTSFVLSHTGHPHWPRSVSVFLPGVHGRIAANKGTLLSLEPELCPCSMVKLSDPPAFNCLRPLPRTRFTCFHANEMTCLRNLQTTCLNGVLLSQIDAQSISYKYFMTIFQCRNIVPGNEEHSGVPLVHAYLYRIRACEIFGPTVTWVVELPAAFFMTPSCHAGCLSAKFVARRQSFETN